MCIGEKYDFDVFLIKSDLIPMREGMKYLLNEGNQFGASPFISHLPQCLTNLSCCTKNAPLSAIALQNKS